MEFRVVLKCSFLLLAVHLLSIKTETVFCPELFSTSLKIECFYEGNTTSCDDPMLNGTIAKLQCKHSYYLDSLPYTEMHCRNGTWNRPLFNCEPVCGMKTSKAIPFIIKGKIAVRGDFPWHIGLYVKRPTYREYICGGSILSPKLVITAAHCFLKMDPKLYGVVAGKVYRQWEHENDNEAQYRDVVSIYNEKRYRGASTGYTGDVSILVLNEVFILSDLIQPVCLDYIYTDLKSIENNTAIVPGWGLTSEQGTVSDYLQYVNLPLRDRDTCLNTVPADFVPQVTLDKICAGYTNGTSVCKGDSGGGLIVPRKIDNETRYFLIGIVSTGPFKSDSCDSYQYTTFTLVKSHIKWINETKFKFENWSPYDYGCFLPDFPSFGHYVIDTDTPNRDYLLPGSLVPHYTKLKYSCNEGYRVHGKESITCKEKKWDVGNEFPACFRTCNKLNSTDLEIEYIFENLVRPTDDSILHETRVVFRCKDINYELEESSFNQTTCRDGEWTNPVPKCIPICGVNGVQTDNDLNKVSNSLSGQYPWNVAIYRKVDNGLSLQCAGTIVSFFVILTEYNCIDHNYQDQYIVISGSNKKIVNSSITDKNIQQSAIFKKLTYHFFDIIILKTHLIMTSFVRPVCLQSLERKFKKNENLTLEIPLWPKDDDDLKFVKFDLNTLYMKTFPNRINLVTNLTDPTVGWLIQRVKFKSNIRYCVLGFGTSNNNQTINVYFIFKEDIEFIQQILLKSDTNNFEINECNVPDTSPHVRSLEYNYSPGDIVLEGTKIKYACDEYYSLYGSKEIVCKNSTWIYPHDEPYCIGCGVSNLFIHPLRFNNRSRYIYSAKPTMFPWTTRVFNSEESPSKFTCYGSIVSSKVILTYNFCVTELEDIKFTDNYKYYVQVGEYNWNTSLNKYYQRASVEEVLFNGNPSKIILLILNKHLQINKHVLPVCLDFKGAVNFFWSSILGALPIGSLKNIDDKTTRVDFINFDTPLLKFWDIFYAYRHKSLYCPDDDYWKMNRGRALTYNLPIHKNEFRYFLFGMYTHSDCDERRLIIIEINSYVNWIKSIIDRNAEEK